MSRDDVFLPFDLSGDGIDDFFLWQDGNPYLCLGGNPLDFSPDYPAGSACRGNLFLYRRAGLPDLLMATGLDWRWPDLRAYPTGISFDTVACAVFDFGFENGWPRNIGDINADGIDEIAVRLQPDTTVQHLNIYGMVTTSISDNSGHNRPDRESLLKCYPNPFNSRTTITLSDMTEAEIAIYDITGRRLALLQAKGGRAEWEAEDVPSGVYLARVVGRGASKAIRLVVIR